MLSFDAITDDRMYQRIRERYATGEITHETFEAAVENRLTGGGWDVDALGVAIPSSVRNPQANSDA